MSHSRFFTYPALSLVLGLTFFSGCQEKAKEASPSAEKSPPKANGPELPEPIRGKDYTLVFQDEFDGAKGSLADPEKWSHLELGKWRQFWNVKDACQQDGEGNLRIAIRRNGDRVESGKIGTNRSFQATHGYFEARCILQKAAGTWSAFWIQTPSMGKPLNDPTKAGVEIDVMEYVGGEASNYYRDKINHTAHWGGYKDPDHQGFHVDKKIPGVSEGYHTFAVKWDEEGYVFYTDNVESGRWPKTVPISNRPQFLILSCESDGWAGDLSKATLPDAFVVDYVRAWQTPAQIAADQTRKDEAAKEELAKKAREMEEKIARENAAKGSATQSAGR